MANAPISKPQRSSELRTLLCQARQMIFATRSFDDIREWIEQANRISDAFGSFSGALEDGCSHAEAWTDADCDLTEFTQWVNHLDAPDFLNDVYGDAEDIASLSDLSRHILQGYADELHSKLNEIHDSLMNLVEDLDYEDDLEGAL